MKRIMYTIIVFLSLLKKESVGQPWTIDIFGGTSSYFGDLVEKKYSLTNARAAIGAGLGYHITPKLSIRGMLTVGKLYAHDKDNRSVELVERNLNFHSGIFEFALLGNYDFLDIERFRITPYLTGGIAAFGFNPYTVDQTGERVYLQPLSTEGQGLTAFPDRKPYKLTQLSIPFGGGIRFRVNQQVNVSWEIALRKSNTDYLDDVSSTYVDEALLVAERGATAASIAFRGDELKPTQLVYPQGGSVRGSPKVKDWYYFSGINVRIALGGGQYPGKASMACPSKF